MNDIGTRNEIIFEAAANAKKFALNSPTTIRIIRREFEFAITRSDNDAALKKLRLVIKKKEKREEIDFFVTLNYKNQADLLGDVLKRIRSESCHIPHGCGTRWKRGPRP